MAPARPPPRRRRQAVVSHDFFPPPPPRHADMPTALGAPDNKFAIEAEKHLPHGLQPRAARARAVRAKRCGRVAAACV